jgi:hypothetical protein
MRLLVCGSRDWSDRRAVYQILDELQPRVIISGACSGADTIAADYARASGVDLIEMPAEWRRHGRAAGPIRNREMLGQSPDLVVAFHPDIKTSKGTRDMVRQAERAGVPVVIVAG